MEKEKILNLTGYNLHVSNVSITIVPFEDQYGRKWVASLNRDKAIKISNKHGLPIYTDTHKVCGVPSDINADAIIVPYEVGKYVGKLLKKDPFLITDGDGLHSEHWPQISKDGMLDKRLRWIDILSPNDRAVYPTTPSSTVQVAYFIHWHNKLNYNKLN